MTKINFNPSNGSIWVGISKYKHFEMRDATNETLMTVSLDGEKSSLAIKNGPVTTFSATVDGDQYKEFGSLKTALKDLLKRMKPKDE